MQVHIPNSQTLWRLGLKDRSTGEKNHIPQEKLVVLSPTLPRPLHPPTLGSPCTHVDNPIYRLKLSYGWGDEIDEGDREVQTTVIK